MLSETCPPTLANMSAPPRSTVTLPRLAPIDTAGKAPCNGVVSGCDSGLATVRDIPVGPGGGRMASNALCVAYIELPKAVSAHLRVGFASPLLTAPLGLARALLAIARVSNQATDTHAQSRAAFREIDRVLSLPESALVHELTARLESFEWPDWVPRVAFARSFACDPAACIDMGYPPDTPIGVACPLLAARLVSAICGPVFLRDAAPSLANLLHLWGGNTPSGTWEIWLPIRPGRMRLIPAATPSPQEEKL